MAQIGYGYGSEWQLLRMLGHHREYFFKEIRKQINLAPDAEIHWLDYDFDKTNKSISGDKEYQRWGFNKMIPHIFTKDVVYALKKDKYGSLLNPYWDGLFWVDKTLFLVEAKAHVKEIESDCKATPASMETIESYFKDTREYFQISTDNDWKKKYYQMANRVAYLKYFLCHKIDVKLVNIYFVDGYEKRVKDPDSDEYIIIQPTKNTSEQQWRDVIAEEEKYLGITELKGKYIIPVFIDCKGNQLIVKNYY